MFGLVYFSRTLDIDIVTRDQFLCLDLEVGNDHQNRYPALLFVFTFSTNLKLCFCFELRFDWLLLDFFCMARLLIFWPLETTKIQNLTQQDQNFGCIPACR